MSKSYTIEDVKVVYMAGQENIPLEDVLKVLEWAEREATTTKGNWGSSGGGKKIKAPRRGKGRLGDQILKYLVTQGGKGAHVKAIAAAVKAKVPNVTAWFYTTGRKLIKAKSIKKMAPATFAFVDKK